MKLDLQTYQLMGLVMLAGIILTQWLRTKKLETKVEQLTQSLLQLVDESEVATNNLRKSLDEINRQEVAIEPNPPALNFTDESQMDEMWNIDRRHRVLTLAKHGLTAGEIAKR